MSRLHNTAQLYAFDTALGPFADGRLAGVDEAGRGPLAGPVVAAAVVLDLAHPIDGVDDSKKLSAQRREKLYNAITARAKAWAVDMAMPDEIDRYNILRATLRAMKRALDKLTAPWSLALIDGNQAIDSLDAPRQRCVVGGDALSASIAAASIVAKVTRDRLMQQYHQQYPEYNFGVHKGYATAAHRAAIRDHGLCAIHRRSFCEALVRQTSLSFEGGAG